MWQPNEVLDPLYIDPLPFQHNRMNYLILCTLEVILIKCDCFDKFF
jgi:hypothetical protein